MDTGNVSDGVGRLRGVVRNGVVVLNEGHGLDEGTEVDVFLAMPKEWEDDLKGWDALSDEAWRTIDWGDGDPRGGEA